MTKRSFEAEIVSLYATICGKTAMKEKREEQGGSGRIWKAADKEHSGTQR